MSDLEFFDLYEALAEHGYCDGPGPGGEYERVFNEWVEHGRPEDAATLIRVRANIGPFGGPFPGTPEWNAAVARLRKAS